MKKWICMLLVCVLLTGCACAEGLLPGLEEVYGVGMPSLYTLLNRYPDSYEETESCVEETWENLSDEDFTAFGEQLTVSGCEMLSYTSENGVFDAEVGKSGKSYHFIYDGNSRSAKLVFPVGTYDGPLYATEQSYENAMAMIEVGEYTQACVVLSDIRGYRDVDAILENDEHLVAAMLQIPGGTVTFGAYEQDNDFGNGPEPIEWIVLQSDGNTSMLISKYALDCKPYNTEENTVTWETCTLRGWLNGDFLNAAFTDEELSQMETVTVTADSNPKYSTDPGNDTQDRVFLLSINEANLLFASNGDRICSPTTHAKEQGAWTNDSGECWWWLRSPGNFSNIAARVNYDGSVNYSGNLVYYDVGSVRPVVVLRLSKSNP